MRSLRIWFLTLCALTLLLASAPPPTQAAPALLNPRLSDGVNSVSTERNFYLTPDGKRVVFLARVGTIDRLYSAPTDGSAPPVLLSPVLTAGHTVDRFLLSPDGSRAIFLFGDAMDVAGGRRELYSAPTDGSVPPIRLSGALSALASVEGFDLSPDGSRVVYRADAFSDATFELFSVPPTGGEPIRLNRPPTPGGSVVGFLVTLDNRFVVYRADLDSDEVVELYVSGLRSQGSWRLSGDLVAGGDVSWFELAADKSSVVYRADQETDGKAELYRASLLALTATKRMDATASAEPAKLNGPLPASGAVGAYQLSPDGAAVVYLADAEQDEQFNLYRVALAGGPVRKLNGPLAAGGAIDENFLISSDGAWVIYRADEQVVSSYELFAVALNGVKQLRLNAELPEQHDVYGARLSPDGRIVVFHAGQAPSSTTLYSVRLPATLASESAGPLVTLSPPLVSGGDVSRHYRVSPAGDRVVYLADQDMDEVSELYSVPLAGGAVTKLNGALVKDGYVDSFRFSADGSRVIYLAAQAEPELFSLYAAYEPMPTVTVSGPVEPLDVGAVELTVQLSAPLALGGVQLLLEPAGGEAVLNQDYSLPGEQPRAVVSFLPGETSRTVLVRALPNLARTTARTVRLRIVGTAAATLGSPHELTLTLAPYQAGGPGGQIRVYLPLVRRT